MKTAPTKPNGEAAFPVIEAQSLADWTAQKPSIQDALERETYGAMPRNFKAMEVNRKTISNAAFNGSAVVEEVRLRFQGEIEFNAVLVTPADLTEPVPIIMMENFCPNHSVIPVAGVSLPDGDYYNCDGDGVMANVFGYFFGRYITTPPVEMIMRQGYALAVVYPHETYPDSRSTAQSYRASSPDPEQPWGAIAAWAYQFSVLSNFLEEDTKYSDLIAYGHSRYGKSALLAAAFDPTIDGVIAHQSGTGGASLSKDKPGETVADITQGYPHWFTPGYVEDGLTVDQHYLLALIAPRPILLGNAKRDVWSDPNGAFRAAQGADSVYELFGGPGLDQERLDKMNSEADIAFWMRPGTHGVVEEDWPAFLEFLNAHFK